VKIYPNPTNERVYIDGIDSEIEYQLCSLGGQIMKQGITYNKTINIENTGLYILKLKVDGIWIFKRIIKIE
jgi:hypothetical protein